MSVIAWFVDSRREIMRAFGDEADFFYRLLAGTSPISTIETNVVLACRAYQHLSWFGELPREGFLSVHLISVTKLLADDPTVGRKVWSLYQNLAGNEQVCPIDRWMLRYFGISDHHWLSPKLYDELEGKIKAEAAALGISPAQRQAAMWCEARGNPISYGDVIRRRGIHRRDLLNKLL